MKDEGGGGVVGCRTMIKTSIFNSFNVAIFSLFHCVEQQIKDKRHHDPSQSFKMCVVFVFVCCKLKIHQLTNIPSNQLLFNGEIRTRF